MIIIGIIFIGCAVIIGLSPVLFPLAFIWGIILGIARDIKAAILNSKNKQLETDEDWTEFDELRNMEPIYPDAEENTIKCGSCKTGEMQESTTEYFSKTQGHYVIIENVPCLECDQCGEKFFRASVTERLQEIISETDHIEGKTEILDYNSYNKVA